MKLELKLNEIREEGRIEGEIKGRREGRREGQRWILISQIQKKLTAKKDIEQIAEEVEESVETIRPIVEILQEHPDYDAEMVYNSLPVTV